MGMQRTVLAPPVLAPPLLPALAPALPAARAPVPARPLPLGALALRPLGPVPAAVRVAPGVPLTLGRPAALPRALRLRRHPRAALAFGAPARSGGNLLPRERARRLSGCW
jgi:hypothetical protein